MTSGKDVIASVTSDAGDLYGTITIKGAKDANVVLVGSDNSEQTLLFNDINEKIFAATDTSTEYIADAAVVTIDATKSKQAVNIDIPDSLSTSSGNNKIVKANGKNNVNISCAGGVHALNITLILFGCTRHE